MQILYLDGCILCTSCYLLFFLLCFLDPEEHPQNEEYWGHVNPIGPRACYDEGKRVAETMCYAYMKQVSSSLHVVNVHVIFKISFFESFKISAVFTLFVTIYFWFWLSLAEEHSVLPVMVQALAFPKFPPALES